MKGSAPAATLVRLCWGFQQRSVCIKLVWSCSHQHQTHQLLSSNYKQKIQQYTHYIVHTYHLSFLSAYSQIQNVTSLQSLFGLVGCSFSTVIRIEKSFSSEQKLFFYAFFQAV